MRAATREKNGFYIASAAAAYLDRALVCACERMAELLTVAEAEELPEGPVYFASLRGEMTTVKNWLKLLEVFAREYAAFNENFAAQLERLDNAGSNANCLRAVAHYTESADILEGTRLAGHSYKRWVLKDYMALLRL